MENVVRIDDCVSAYISQRRYKQVLVLGTETTVKQDLYGKCANTVVYPDKQEQKIVSDIIIRVLAGIYLQRDRETLEDLKVQYRYTQKVKNVMLACTELSVLLARTSGKRSDFIDPLRLLAGQLASRSQNGI